MTARTSTEDVRLSWLKAPTVSMTVGVGAGCVALVQDKGAGVCLQLATTGSVSQEWSTAHAMAPSQARALAAALQAAAAAAEMEGAQ